MNTRECERELETLAAARDGRPLDAHVMACAACSEVAVVATAFVSDYNAAMKSAPVPTSGVVWWRIQRRLRAQAVREVSRTVTLVHVMSVVAAIVIAVAIIGATQWVNWAKTVAQSLSIDALVAMMTGPAVFVVFAWVLLAPVAVYFSVRD